VGWVNKLEGGEMSEEVMTPEAVHRSPHTFEIVKPTDGRSTQESVEKRVAGRQAHSNCGSDQLLPNNDLIDHPVMEAAETDPLRLFASETNPPNFAIIHEKPEHRLIVYLKAKGLSNKEVSDRTGYTQAWISQVCRQPWFRLRIVQELKEAGLDQISEILKGAVVDSIFTIIDIRDDDSAPKAVRKACADSLLDRWLGKPTVHVAHDDGRMPSSPEITAVDTELQQIDNQLKEANGQTEV
jgi:hypothetical protein